MLTLDLQIASFDPPNSRREFWIAFDHLGNISCVVKRSRDNR